jgi:hypothetical protein
MVSMQWLCRQGPELIAKEDLSVPDRGLRYTLREPRGDYSRVARDDLTNFYILSNTKNAQALHKTALQEAVTIKVTWWRQL